MLNRLAHTEENAGRIRLSGSATWIELYQQQGKRLISLYPADKSRLDEVLRAKLALFGHHIPPTPPRGVGEH